MSTPTETDDAPRRRVLVVDDERFAREMVDLLLTARGARVTTADGAETALSAIEQDVFDVIVVDKNMPGVDGIELIRRIRAIRSVTGHEPAIAMLTGDAIEASREAAIEAGADLFVTKPPSPAVLDAMIDLRR